MLRFASRDLRGGLKGLWIFLLCIALGVAAVVGVESLARALNDGLGLGCGEVVLADLLAPVIVDGGAHAPIHRKALAGVALVDAAGRRYVAIVSPVGHPRVPQSQRFPQRRIESNPAFICEIYRRPGWLFAARRAILTGAIFRMIR